MTINEAIKHEKCLAEMEELHSKSGAYWYHMQEYEYHTQVAEWLEELQKYKECEIMNKALERRRLDV